MDHWYIVTIVPGKYSGIDSVYVMPFFKFPTTVFGVLEEGGSGEVVVNNVEEMKEWAKRFGGGFEEGDNWQVTTYTADCLPVRSEDQ